MKKRKSLDKLSLLLTVISILFAVIMLLPIVWALFCSLQSESKQFAEIWDWFKPPFTLVNFPNIVQGTDVLRWFMNSLVVAVIATALTLLFSTMAAYAIARVPFKGSFLVYLYIMIGLLVPTEATIVPLFVLCNDLKLIDSYAGLILPTIPNAMMVIIAVQFFKGLPKELFEAVRIDGGSDVTIYLRIVMPLSKPILATITMMTFIGSWNNYLWPLLCSFDSRMFTLPIGIPTLLSIERPNYVVPMTGAMVASIPIIILYLIFEKQIVAGLTLGSVKG